MHHGSLAGTKQVVNTDTCKGRVYGWEIQGTAPDPAGRRALIWRSADAQPLQGTRCSSFPVSPSQCSQQPCSCCTHAKQVLTSACLSLKRGRAGARDTAYHTLVPHEHSHMHLHILLPQRHKAGRPARLASNCHKCLLRHPSGDKAITCIALPLRILKPHASSNGVQQERCQVSRRAVHEHEHRCLRQCRGLYGRSLPVLQQPMHAGEATLVIQLSCLVQPVCCFLQANVAGCGSTEGAQTRVPPSEDLQQLCSRTHL